MIKKTTRCLAVILALVMLAASLAACGAGKGSPSSTVKTLFEGIKKFDEEKIKSCLLDPGDSDGLKDLESNETLKSLMKYMKEWASKLKYGVEDEKVEGDSASVTVKCEYTDASSVMTAAISNYMKKGAALALSGATEEKLASLFGECFEEASKNAAVDKAESTVTLDLVRSGSDWKIKDLPGEVADIMTSRAISAMTSLIK